MKSEPSPAKDTPKKEKENKEPIEFEDTNEFDVYKSIKANLRCFENLCKDHLSEQSYYCLDCKCSTCPSCPNFEDHNDHKKVLKYPYYEVSPELVDNYFHELEDIFAKNPDYLDLKKTKEDMKNLVETEFKEMSELLETIKNAKLEEIDSLFNDDGTYVADAKKAVTDIKQKVYEYLRDNKRFYNVDGCEVPDPKEKANNNNNPPQPKEEKPIDNADKDLPKTYEEEQQEEGLRASLDKVPNEDYGNIIFLANYDLLDLCANRNQKLLDILNSLKNTYTNYFEILKNNSQNFKTEINKLNEPFLGTFNYPDLTSKDYYAEVQRKMEKYLENMEEIKNCVYKTVRKHGNFSEIEKVNEYFEAKKIQSIENVLNHPENTKVLTTQSMKSLGPFRNKMRQIDGASKSNLSKSSARIIALSGKMKDFKYLDADDVILNTLTLQKFYAYSIYELAYKYFKKKKGSNELLYDTEDMDADFEIVKPIPNSNEIQIYDKKTNSIVKKKVPMDKNKLKYNYFLTGSRSVLIKDRLFITGGVDKEKNLTKVCYVYYIKSNELKLLPEMSKGRAYHSIVYFEHFKSIFVFGGENNASCELYDMYNARWRSLPDLNYPRAYSSIYLDKFSNSLYCCFGVVGSLTDSNMNYTDVIEILELKRTGLGWGRVNYKNRTDMDFHNCLCKIFPIDKDKILIYGASVARQHKKKSAIFLLNTCEFIKVDSKTFNDLRTKAKSSRRLSQIITSIA